jgi:hypothetical protein
MRMRFALFIGGALLAAASLCLAQTGGKMAKPKGKAAASKAAPAPRMAGSPENAKLTALEGNWHCTGKTMASPMGPEHATEGNVSVKMDLGGHWLVSHYRETKTAANPTPMDGDEYWMYDGAEKKWDRIAIDSWGGWSAGDAKGWEGDSITWNSEGMMGGKKAKYHDTFTKKSDHEVVYKGQMQSNGKWVDIWETTCTK